MRLLVSTLILCLSAAVYGGDLSFREAIVYVEADQVVTPDGRVGRGQLSAVCVSEDGVFLTAGHGGFTRGRIYKANRGTDTETLYELKCLSDRTLNDEAGEGVVVLKDMNPKNRHTYVAIGKTPELTAPVFGMGYAGGRFTYAEGMVIGHLNGTRFIKADFRLLEGASGGGLFDEKHRLVGILSTRSMLASETRDGTTDGPYTRWIGVDVFKQCVDPYLN